MRFIGKFISGVGMICYIVFGLWGFILSLTIIHEVGGFWGLVFAFVVAPVTFVAAPWYALIHWGTWFPLLITYGGFIVAAILQGIGGALSGES